MRQRRKHALMLLLIGVPALLALMLLPGHIFAIRDELDWRNRRDAYEYLSRWPRGSYELLALAEVDAAQRNFGFISRLVSSRYGDAYLTGSDTSKAAWRPDASQVLTGSAGTAIRWDADTGRQAQVLGEPRRRDAKDPNKWGYGFTEVAWIHGGADVVAMTSGPHSLWFFGPGARDPILLDGDGYEGLTAMGNRLAFIRNLEYGNVLDLTTHAIIRLPHREITAIGLSPDGAEVTVSRNEVKWWRNGNATKTVAIQAAYNPSVLSDDAKLALVLAQNVVEVWFAETGARLTLPHDAQATAVCATTDTVVTATDDGMVHLWSAREGRLIRRFRAGVTSIDLLACAPTRLLTVGRDRTDARVWDMRGVPRAGPILKPAAPRMSWISQWGADVDLPGRMPRLSRWLESLAYSYVHFWALGGLVLLLAAAKWVDSGAGKE